MRVSALIQHLQDTAPGDAEILVLSPMGEMLVQRARVETRPGHYAPVVVLHLAAPQPPHVP